MITYQSKAKKISGNSYRELKQQANTVFKNIKSKTKRRPYVRSAYFNKQKIFFDYFWDHLFQKTPKERFERLKYFEAAVDLIKNCKNQPESRINANKNFEILHRFYGRTKDKSQFCVQIKEDKKSDKKYFMSCFPWE